MSDLKQYFNERPSLKISSIEKEAKIPRCTLDHFLKGRRVLKDEHLDLLIPVLRKYGLVEKSIQLVENSLQDHSVVEKNLQQSNSVEKSIQGEKSVPKKVQGKKQEASEKAGFIFNLCTAAWFYWFEEKKGIKPAFDGAEGKALKMIIKKLVEKARQRDAEDTPASIQNAFKWLLTRVESDDWIFQNADLKLINSKFNPLIAKKNGTTKALPTDNELIAEAQRIADQSGSGPKLPSDSELIAESRRIANQTK